jgi:5S rRNA maturation endonuclease (ribonuclease M5)
MDLNTGKLIEKENIIHKKEDIYLMTDPDFMVDKLGDDLMIQLHLLSGNMVNEDVDHKGLKRLSEILGLPEVDLSDTEKMIKTAGELRNKYSFEATKYILREAEKFARERDKKLLIIHFDPYGVMRPMINGIPRYDQEVIDFIKQENLNYFDMNEVHVEDFRKFNLSLDEYMDRYFIGHYNPSGNHFFAYALKDRIVKWLDPKPITYLPSESKRIGFEGYLPK